MGFLDKLFGRKKKAEPTRNTSVAKGNELQSDDVRAEGRRKMEAEVEARRAQREEPKE